MLAFVAEEPVSIDLRFTAVFEEVAEGYIADVEELSGVDALGAALDEARESLEEAVEFVLDAKRSLADERLGSGKILREPLRTRI